MTLNYAEACEQVQRLLTAYPKLNVIKSDPTIIQLCGSIEIYRSACNYTLQKEYPIEIIIPLDNDKLPTVIETNNMIDSDYPHRYSDGSLCLETYDLDSLAVGVYAPNLAAERASRHEQQLVSLLIGITRKRVMEALKRSGLELQIGTFKPEELDPAKDAVFVSSTPFDILPVRYMDGYEFRSSDNEVLKMISKMYKEYTSEYINAAKRALNGQ